MTQKEIYNLLTHEERIKVANHFYPPHIHQIIKREKVNMDKLQKLCAKNYKK